MLVQLFFAFGLAGVTVIIHALGTSAVIVHLTRLWQHTKADHELFSSGVMMARVVGALLLLHLIETAILRKTKQPLRQIHHSPSLER